MHNINKSILLQELSGIAQGYGIAEFESKDEQQFLKNFLPSSQYKSIFEPDIFLILGGRGTGKTELFKLFNLSSGRTELYMQTKSRAFTYLKNTEWLVSFGHHRQTKKRFPTSDVIEKLMENASEEKWRTFWIGLLTGIILSSDSYQTTDIFLHEELKRALIEHLSRPSEWLPLVNRHYEEISDFLDTVDNYLIEEDKWLFCMYDELDKIINSYHSLAIPIRTLLAYWLERWRRWERIRPKIFLRNDLFREDFLGFADASKLRPHLLRLDWSTIDLYQLLTKRLANKSKDWCNYLETTCKVALTKDATFGIIPTSNEPAVYENMMTAIVGRFMGANARKGKTYTWIPNHLQDGDSKIAPRSFLKLFVLAAENRLSKVDALSDTHLLLPLDLQAALQETSKDRIRELADEEYPWLNALQQQLQDMEVPAEQKRFIMAIQHTKWTRTTPPPTKDELELLDYLKRLGIIEIRLDKRINVPEIYLYGFGMKRRGGVKRAK